MGFPTCTPLNSFETLPIQNVDTYGETYGSDVETSGVKTIEEERFYKIIFSDNRYCYWIYDKNHNIVKSGEPLIKKPYISMVNEYLVRVTLQSGTGIGT